MQRIIGPSIAIFLAFHSSEDASADFFLSWFEVPEEVQVGETFKVDLWIQYDGQFDTSTDMFAGLLTSIALVSTQASASFASSAYNSPVALPGPGELSDALLRNVTVGQLATVGPFEVGNPLRLLSFDIDAGAHTGSLSIEHAAHDAVNGVLATWYFNGFSSFETFDSDDPDIDLFLEPATVRVVPAPASAAVLALAFAFRRRR